jgi:3-keto-5-aminohexanoate cleavage enzyme
MDLIVNLAPTGMIPTKAMTPHVPVSVSEIVEDVHEAWEIGITMVHLHARDPRSGEPTYRTEVYQHIIEGIRGFSKDLVVCVSLSGRKFQEFEKRAAPLQLDGDAKPDMGSLTLSSVNFNHVASINSPDTIQALAREMMRRGILAELEVFDVGMINYAKYLEKKGLLEPPHYFNLVLGNIACAQADLLHAGLMVRDLPPQSVWSMAGVGDAQRMMNAIAIAAGGGVRVGLEDNIWYDPARTRLACNADLIRRIHRLAEANERQIMAPRQLRSLLGLQDGSGRYGRLFRIEAEKSGSASPLGEVWEGRSVRDPGRS